MEKVKYDNDVIKKIDKDMGWIEKDGSSPSKTADEQGYDCKFIEPLHTAWRNRKTGLWSCCILNYRALCTTLLAKSFKALVNKNKKLRERVDKILNAWEAEGNKFRGYGPDGIHPCKKFEKLRAFYSDMHTKNYDKWVKHCHICKIRKKEIRLNWSDSSYSLDYKCKKCEEV